MSQHISGHQPNQGTFHVVKNVYEEIQAMVQLKMKGAALSLVSELFAEEVERCCGSAFSRKKSGQFHRGGSENGSVIVGGQRMSVTRPRMRDENGEQELESYTALQSFDVLCDRVMKHMVSGVSTRNYDGLLDELSGGLGLKKTTVSKAFIKGSRQALDELNGRDLSEMNFVSIMVDGIPFGDRMVIVALGVTTTGGKIVLGLREGDTENSEVCKDLLRSLIERGLDEQCSYLFVIDGSKALKKAIRKVFGQYSPVQRCVRHKERNILSYLSHGLHLEFRRKWKKLHGYTHFSDAKKEYEQLLSWLNQNNYQAATSLEEAEMETLTVIRLQVPSTLRQTLLSTNPIESMFSMVEDKSHRVKNWKGNPDMVSRWAATTLMEAEKRMRKIYGYREIPVLLEELNKTGVAKESQMA